LASQDKKLLEICRQVCVHAKRVSEIHSILDEHARTGSMPVNPDDAMVQDELSRGDIARILCNYPPTIHKAKYKLRSLPETDAEAIQLAKNIEIWESELARARAYKNEP
jgi:adenylate kinase family enzyme